MVTKVMRQPPAGGDSAGLLHNLGLVITAASAVLGLLTWFVLPAGCSFVSGIQILILASLFVLGLVAAFVGRVLLSRQAKAARNGSTDS